MHTNPNLPNYGCDVHPMFSAAMHDECGSKVEDQCSALNVSIHDRDAVWEQMKLDEQKINHSTE